MATIEDVADLIIFEGGGTLSHRELQKLLYFAQGFYLARHEAPLFPESLEAWKFGPVNGRIFAKYKEYGYHLLACPNADQLRPVPAEVKSFIAGLVLAFGSVGQQTLIDYSHFDSPWAMNYIPGANKVLPHAQLQQYFSSFSSFEEYLQVSKKKLDLHRLVENRADYLRTLPGIGEDWISGGAKAPSEQTCKVACDFLRNFERFLFANNSVPSIPKIVLGPIPSGGVGVELTTERNALYIHIHNDQRVEIDIENDGHFREEETTIGQFEEDFGTYFLAFSA